MSTATTCPNCSAEIKNKLLSLTTNQLMPAHVIAIINLAKNDNAVAYCERCCGSVSSSVSVVKAKLQKLKSELTDCLRAIPVLNLQHPDGWNYTACDIVTGQSVTGTGVLSEIDQSISDFFGTQSESLNSKLRNGEQLCLDQLRIKAADIGANAVIAVDIDYAELGSGRGMIMVCCTGTAVHIDNAEVLKDTAIESIARIPELQSKLKELNDALRIYNMAHNPKL